MQESITGVHRVREIVEVTARGLRAQLDPEPRSPRRDPREVVRHRQRFVTRAQALAIVRFSFLGLAALALLVHDWRSAMGLRTWMLASWWGLMLLYSTADLWQLRRLRFGGMPTLISLHLDLLSVVAMASLTGGLHSLALSALSLVTIMFALLFPRPLALFPPLLSLFVVGVMHGVSGGRFASTDLAYLLWYGVLSLIAFYAVLYLTRSQEGQENEIVQLEQELKSLALLDERARLSREIHDGLGAALSGLIIQAEFLLTMTHDKAMRSEIDELKDSAEEAIEELRRSLQMMREEFDLVPSLRSTVENFRNRHHLPCQIEIIGTPPRLSSEQQLTIFRILQECLNNAAKHARAKRVTVRVRFYIDGLNMQVVDDGRGFDMRRVPKHHYGLINMRDRARKVGGDVLVETEPGEGTGVTFMLRGVGGEATREAAIPVRYTAQKK